MFFCKQAIKNFKNIRSLHETHTKATSNVPIEFPDTLQNLYLMCTNIDPFSILKLTSLESLTLYYEYRVSDIFLANIVAKCLELKSFELQSETSRIF